MAYTRSYSDWKDYPDTTTPINEASLDNMESGIVNAHKGLAADWINQSSHGFSVGNVLRHNGTTFVKAQADSAANAEAIGIVSEVIDTNNYVLKVTGFITGLSSLTAGTTYFLSPSSAGALTATEPSTSGQISKPVLIATSTTAGVFINMRGAVVS